MFESIKEDYIKEMDRCTNILNDVNDEISQKKEELDKIDEYKIIKGHLKVNTVWLFAYGIATVLSIPILSSGVNIITIFLSLGLGGGLSLHLAERNDCKNKIKCKYKKYLGLNKKELKELEKLLNKELSNLKSNNKNIEKEIDRINYRIHEINIFNLELQEIALLTNDVRIMEDKKYLLNALEVSRNYTVQNYLNEKVDYSSVHFSNEFQKDDGKKLVKKL